MYPAALRRTLTQTVDSSQNFQRWFLQKQLKVIEMMTKSWEKGESEVWNKIVPKNTTIWSLDCCRQRQFCLTYFILFSSHLVNALRDSLMNLWKIIETFNIIFLRRHWQYFSECKSRSFKRCIVQVPSKFALHSAQSGVLLHLNWQLEQVHVSFSALRSKSFRTLGQPWSSQFSPV